jgi:BirA family biotin operon repressor/biotin-[acetyl-CoA-carboxylase] ligase
MPPDSLLLKVLRAAAVSLPLGELAVAIGADLAATRARIEALRAAGFEIHELPGLGFRLVRCPDRLIADDLWSRMRPCPGLREILAFTETDSTNANARRLGHSGAPGGLAIFAERQTDGRGRFGRRWHSQAGLGLWFSLLLRPEFPPALWPRLTTCAAVAIAGVLEAEAGIATAIKWPNDIEIEGKKAAGILCEAATDAGGGAFVVVGVGLNINHGSTDFPEELRARATSLKLSAGRVWDRPALAASLLERLFSDLEKAATGFDEIVAMARAKSALLGRRIAVAAGGVAIEGIAEDLDGDGLLILRCGDGTRHTLAAGEASISSAKPGDT